MSDITSPGFGYETGVWMKRCEAAQSELTTLRTRLQQVESERDKAEVSGYVAGLREAERLVGVHFAPNTVYVSEIRQAIDRATRRDIQGVCDEDNQTLHTRLQEAERLLSETCRYGIHQKPEEWFDRRDEWLKRARDTFLNPKPQDVK